MTRLKRQVSAVKTGDLSSLQRMMMKRFYVEAAGDPTKLPWHRQEPSALLVKVAASRSPGRALDVGCGSGVFSRYLASLGYDVVAVDLFAEAAAMARRFSTEGASFTVIEADILKYETPHPFDLVYDSGCLHNFNGKGVRRYAEQLDRWLAPTGDFVLEHWGKRNAFDWRPIGPYRRSERVIATSFKAQFRLCEVVSETFDVPFPLGPRVRGVSYQFKRS